MTEMSKKELDMSIIEFRDFLTDHPKLVKEVKQKEESWQPYYEKWVLLGELDPYWNQYKQADAKQEKQGKQASKIMDKLRKWTESADMDQIQEKMKQWDETITIIQGMLNQYQENKQEKSFTRNYDENNYRD